LGGDQYVKEWFKDPPRVVEGREGEIAREQKKRTVTRTVAKSKRSQTAPG
jgi:hypothetical protein